MHHLIIFMIASILIIDFQSMLTPVSALSFKNKWISSTQQVALYRTRFPSILGSPLYPQMHDVSKSNYRSVTLYVSDSSKAADSSTSVSQSPSDPYLKHSCKSCSYVYDEEKGFKKRYPPGKIR